MNEDPLQVYLSIYQSFLPILSLFLGFILTTIVMVSFLETPIEMRRFLLWPLLVSFLVMDYVLVRTHVHVLSLMSERGISIPCPPWNDELMTLGMLALCISLCFVILINGLSVCEAIIFGISSLILEAWTLLRIKEAKKDGRVNKTVIVLKS